MSDLVGNPEDRFSRVEAQIQVPIKDYSDCMRSYKLRQIFTNWQIHVRFLDY